MKTICKSIVPIFWVILLTSLLLTVPDQAQSETSYIIVHVLNPEGIEIASIEGMDPNCVQIYDGDILIGYGAHDSATYNKPITISSGAHTIKVEFNAMTLEQNINPDSGETKILVFTFERTEFDIASWINGWGVEGEVSIKGSAHMDQYTPYVYDVETKHLPSNGKLGVLFHVMLDLEDSTSYSEVSWNNTAKVKLTACSFYEYGHSSFSCSGNAIVHGVRDAYYYAWGDESTDNFASPTSEFENWFVQSIQNGYYPEISVRYTTGGNDTTGDTTTIDSNSDRALLFGYRGLLPYYNHYRITPIQANVGYTDFSIHGGYWLGGDSFYVQDYCEDSTLEYTGSLIAEMSSVPYNLTGTGIQADTGIQVKSLFTVIPGINDHGEEMIEGARILLSCGDECLVLEIREVDNLSDEQIRQQIIETSVMAKEEGKDIIVNVDMDLENYVWEFPLPSSLNRWYKSVEWGGRIANLVSQEFREQDSSGICRLYAHSAGVDATHRSIRQGPGERMYDHLYLLNGRTNGHKLRAALRLNDYEWWRVKVFTSRGDLPALPWMSLSNYDAARQLANRGAWVHLHSLDIQGHSGLRDGLITGETGRFDVSVGGLVITEYLGTVADMMLNDWLSESESGVIAEGKIEVANRLYTEEALPEGCEFYQNYPNPFNPVTEISFSLPAASHVRLEIFNVMGQKVATLVDGQFEAGEHIIQWDGSKAASGVYLYRLQAGDFVDTKKMMLLK